MVEAGVWLTLTAIVVLALLTVVSIRVMADVLAEGEEPAEEPGPDDDHAAADGGTH